jgi:TPR repeat protein
VGAQGAVVGSSADTTQQIFQLWLRAAEQGHAAAQRMVGHFYLRGVGTAVWPSEARRWLAAAARQGDAGAMVLLGGMLLQQAPNPLDRSKADEQALAAELFRRAAAKGNIDAQYNLGVCLRHGLGVQRDNAKAERLYSAAAQRGHPLAQQALSVLQRQMIDGTTTIAGTAIEAAAKAALALDRREIVYDPG